MTTNVLLIHSLKITLRFTCGESNSWENIKKSQNILPKIAEPNDSTGHQTIPEKKIELYPTKAAPQWTQLSGVKLEKSFISCGRLKTQNHFVIIGLFCFSFSFLYRV